MAKVLVFLVSDQTVPNVLFIKANMDADKYLFFTTKKMLDKGKTKNILKSAGIHEKKSEKRLISENSLEEIEAELNRYPFDIKDEYLVNITCGTKIMSLAMYDFFSKRNCSIYYYPINKNSFDKIYPLSYESSNLEIFLNMQEYFDAYGIDFKTDNSCVKTLEENSNFMLNIFDSFRNEIRLLVEFQKYPKVKKKLARSKKISIHSQQANDFFNDNDADKEKIIKLLNLCRFDENNFKRKDLRYITGGWFEEYIFQKVSAVLGVAHEHVAMSVEINKSGSENELDIVYMKNNTLNIIECKTGLDDKGRNLVTETLYKQAALRADMGLTVESHLFTMESIEKESEIKRAKTLGIRIVDKKILLMDEALF